MTSKIITKLENIAHLQKDERKRLTQVTERFPFRATDYYLSLINWNDPDDPLKRVVLPNVQEMMDFEGLDPSNEKSNRVMDGLQHKYDETALFQVSEKCLQLCRYCFRKRIFINGDKPEVLEDVDGAIKYVRSHPIINNVLLTGGDAYLTERGKLEEIVAKLREIEHVGVIRVGTRVPVVDPHRILEEGVVDMLGKYSYPDRKIYIMTHFVHPRELTTLATEAINYMQRKGLVVFSQAPMIRLVNDNSEVLASLFNGLAECGVTPHYIFQCRPVEGNRAYSVQVERGYGEFRKAQDNVSGPAKKARYVMSHSSGKIEVVGMDEDFIYMQYARARNGADYDRFMVFFRDDHAKWFDEYRGREVKLARPSPLILRTQSAG
jgi:lysine 2,3-aminomutase